MLALLLLNANEVVGHDSLIEGLWGEWPPDSGRHTVAVYVSRLRKRLQDAGIESHIESRPGGYLLRCDPEQVDLYRFEHMIEDGKAALEAGALEQALEFFDRALALWRGEPLSDLAAEPFAGTEIRWLEELRLHAVEARIDAALALGREADLVGELELLVARHPYRERLRVQLMTCLYRSGRQVDALEVYRDGRRLFVDELGIEPGEELQAVERAILRHDPPMKAAVGTPAPPPRQAEHARPGGFFLATRFRWAVVTIAALAALITGLMLAFDGREDRASGFSGPGLASLDPATGKTVAFIATASPPGAVAAADGAIWVTQPKDGTVLRLDPRRGSVVGKAKVGDETGGMIVRDGTVWVVSSEAGAIDRIDAATGTVAKVIRVGNKPTALAQGYGSIWVVNDHDRTVSRVDPETGRAVAVIATDSTGPGLAVGAGGVWVTDEPGGRVIEIDPRTNRVAFEIRVGTGPTALAVEHGAVWVANRIEGTVSRIDARSRTVTATFRVGNAPSAVLTRRGTIWVANELSDTLSCIAAATGAQSTVPVSGNPTGLSAFGDRMIVLVRGS